MNRLWNSIKQDTGKYYSAYMFIVLALNVIRSACVTCFNSTC